MSKEKTSQELIIKSNQFSTIKCILMWQIFLILYKIYSAPFFISRSLSHRKQSIMRFAFSHLDGTFFDSLITLAFKILSLCLSLIYTNINATMSKQQFNQNSVSFLNFNEKIIQRGSQIQSHALVPKQEARSACGNQDFLNLVLQLSLIMSDRLKDYFDSSLSMSSKLREQFFRYESFAQKGRVKLKKRIFAGGKEHFDFDNSTQDYYYEKLQTLNFQKPEVQQFFYQHLIKSFATPLNVPRPMLPREQMTLTAQKILKKDCSLERVIVKLTNHFKLHRNSLRLKKLRMVNRFYNLFQDQKAILNMNRINTRLTLIDSQILMCQRRIDRIKQKDCFQQAIKTIGKKPVPVNDMGTPIYKQLDDQESCSTNLDRDDFQVMFRRRIFQFECKKDFFQLKSRLNTFWLQQLYDCVKFVNRQVLNQPRVSSLQSRRVNFHRLNQIFAIEAQDLKSSVQARQKIQNFLIAAYRLQVPQSGIYKLNQRFDQLAIVPSFFFQYKKLGEKCLPFYFKGLTLEQGQGESLIFKLNHFISIIFKYQCKDIVLDNMKQNKVKLPLFQDDIDLYKQLCTTLEQAFVSHNVIRARPNWLKYFSLNWEIQDSSWNKIATLRNLPPQQNFDVQKDTQLHALIKLLDVDNYRMFRGQLKQIVEQVHGRASSKLMDMRYSAEWLGKDQTQAEAKALRKVYNIFQEQLAQKRLQQQIAPFQDFFQEFCKKQTAVNSSYLQALYGLFFLKSRELKRTILGMLNGQAAFCKRVSLELQAIQFDDRLIIDANKQDKDMFQKKFKETIDPNASFVSGFRGIDDSFSAVSRAKPQQVKASISSNYLSAKRSPMMRQWQYVQRHESQQQYEVRVYSDRFSCKRSILFSCVLEQFGGVQERMLTQCSYLISRYQRYIKLRKKPKLVDRFQLLFDYLQAEAKYQTAKFQLMEEYIEIFQQTVDPHALYQLAHKIIYLSKMSPSIDPQSFSFKDMFNQQIKVLQLQRKLLSANRAILHSRYKSTVKTFHERIRQLLKIPLHREATIYRDIEQKQKKQQRGQLSLQRKNSISSRVTLRSNLNLNNPIGQRIEQISQVSQEDSHQSQFEDEREQLLNYDQYMLSRNMDQLFQDIARNQQSASPTLRKKTVTSKEQQQVAIQNFVVNKRVEGGPHNILTFKKLPKCHFTSQAVQQTEYPNFSQFQYLSIQLQESIQNGIAKLWEQYNFRSQLSRLGARRFIYQSFLKELHSYKPKTVQPLFQQEFSLSNELDFIGSVHRNTLFFKKVIAPTLQQSSALLHDQHVAKCIQALSPTVSCMQFDLKFILSVSKGERPTNILKYREMSIYCGAVSLLSLMMEWYKIQLQRRGLSKLYKKYGNYLGYQKKKNGCLFVKQQNKISSDGVCFPEGLQSLKKHLFLHKVFNLGVLPHIQSMEIAVRKYLLMGFQLQVLSDPYSCYKFQNSLVNEERVFTQFDNLKKLKGRMESIINTQIAQYRKNSYVKSRQNLMKHFSQAQAKGCLSISEITLPSTLKQEAKVIVKEKLTFQLFVQLKFRKALALLQFFGNHSQKVELKRQVVFLDRLRSSVPALAQVFTMQSNDQILEKVLYFDQKRFEKKSQISSVLIEGKTLVEPFFLMSDTQINLLDLYKVNDYSSFDFKQFILQLLEQAKLQEKSSQQYKLTPPLATAHQFQNDAFQYFLKLKGYFTGSKRHNFGNYFFQKKNNNITNLLNHYNRITSYLLTAIRTASIGLDQFDLQAVFRLLKFGLPLSKSQFGKESKQLVYQKIREQGSRLFGVGLEQWQGRMVSVKSRMKELVKGRSELSKFFNQQQIFYLQNSVCRNQSLYLRFLPLADQLKLIAQKARGQDFLFLSSLLERKTHNLHKLTYLALNKLVTDYESHSSEIHHQFIANLYHPFPKNQINLCFTDTTCHSVYVHGALLQSSFDTKRKMCFYRRLNSRKSSDMFHRIKVGLACLPLNLEQVLFGIQQNYSQKGVNLPQNFSLLKQIRRGVSSPFSELNKDFALIMRFAEQQRVKISVRMSNIVKELNSYIQYKQVKKQDIVSLSQREDQYLSKLVELDFRTFGHLAIQAKLTFPVNQTFLPAYKCMYDKIQTKIINAKDNLEKYLQSNRLMFTKFEKDMLATKFNLTSSGDHAKTYQRLLDIILLNKIIKEDSFSLILSQAISIVSNQRALINTTKRFQPKEEVTFDLKKSIDSKKGVFNAGLVPRVKIIPCFSSPLVNDRKSYIKNKYKLAFVQAFINRMRNKVSRVDLLSSGFGFVITVNDLQDCVNFLNKSLFSFVQKEFKYRMDTFAYLYNLLVSMIRQKSKDNQQLQRKFNLLKQRFEDISQSLVIRKTGTVVQENYQFRAQLSSIDKHSKGLQERLRTVLDLQYKQRMKQLHDQNKLLKQRFNDFKQTIATLTKFQVDLNSKALAATILRKTNQLLDKRVQEKEFKTVSVPQVPQGQTSLNLYDKLLLSHEEAQGDPYQLKGLLSKIRAMNNLRISTTKSKYQTRIKTLEQKVKSLQSVLDQNLLSYQSHVQLSQEMIKVQSKVSDLRAKNDQYKSKLQTLQAQKSKLEFMNIEARKKIERYQKDLKRLQNYQKYDLDKLLSEIKDKDQKILKLNSLKSDYAKQLDSNSRTFKTKISALQKTVRQERSLLQKSSKKQQSQMPFLQLSDFQSHWKDKCFQLYNQNQELKKRLQEQRLPVLQTGSQAKRTRGRKSII